MPWMRGFAKIWNSSQSHLAIAREWLALAWALIGGPKGFAPLLNSKAMQKKLRWMLRLSEALLRLAITKRAKAIALPPVTSARRRLGGGALAPLQRPDAPYVARFRLDAPDDRWAIRPPAKTPLTRKPRQPIALLFRLMACQDGLDRFEILARKEARRWRRHGGVTQQVLRHAPGEADNPWLDDANFAATTPLPWEAGARSAAPDHYGGGGPPEEARHSIFHAECVGEADAPWHGDPCPYFPDPSENWLPKPKFCAPNRVKPW